VDPGVDDAIEVLFRPWSQQPPTFTPGDRVLFLGARATRRLDLVAPAELVVVQPFRPWAAGLEAAGLRATAEADVGDGFAAALVLPQPQREAARAELGRAALAVRPGGALIACAPTRLGGSRLAEEVAQVAEVVVEDTKARCRVVVGRVGEDRTTARAWAALDAPVRILDGAFLSRPGVFGWDEVDTGSALLARTLPSSLPGRVVDAGAGWGWLAAALLERRPAELHLLEADARALALAEVNLAGRAGTTRVVPHWVDATAPWPVRDVDAVVTNPPFHVGGRTDPDVGRAFLERAADALAPGGRLWVVANRHLPYEATLKRRFGRFEVAAEAQGFKVLTAAR
jgi:16S rRNA (guanine1207-N2)-methyltransferase